MKRRTLTLSRFAAPLAALLLAHAAFANDAARDITWRELVPKNWNPVEELKRNAPMAGDDSPESMRLLREIWDKAPAVDSLDRVAVRLPGYVVPLESSQGALKEFLLVPYFGACIHTPPPPANQIVHVTLATPAKNVRSMDVVTVRGQLRVQRVESWMGVAGYRLAADAVEPYVAPKR